ncbi:pleckstrin homology domain-containing family G member 5-like [Anneissia japonica]|uniref:pleckstrin homology domain-containing family G member 5-like n=1 Tax=Anneissia japonica TaxID=1529436 RepID=UPI001425AE8E|nr:pleckstrin homology domain-containing family G member 5-like [Anneissia japonica]
MIQLIFIDLALNSIVSATEKEKELGDTKERIQCCQNQSCPQPGTPAAKSCHNSGCTSQNNNEELMLCVQCDQSIHSAEQFSGHTRLNVHQGSDLLRGLSSKSAPGRMEPTNSDPEMPDVDPNVDSNDMDSKPESGIGRSNSKLQRKAVIKRRHTETKKPSVDETDSLKKSLTLPPLLKVLGSPKLDQRMRDFFYVDLEVVGAKEVAKVPAIKGKNLREAIQQLCENRKISINNIQVFLESSSSPLPLEIPSYPLGGQKVFIRSKRKDSSAIGDGRRTVGPRAFRTVMKNLEEKDSDSEFGQTYRKDIFGHLGIAPHPSLDLGQEYKFRKDIFGHLGITPPAQKQYHQKNIFTHLGMSTIAVASLPVPESNSPGARRVSLPLLNFNATSPKEIKDIRLMELEDKLQLYMEEGLPDFPALLSFDRKEDELDGFLELEESWKNIYSGDPTLLTKQQRDQQEAIWEILCTEVSYLKKLNIIVDLFLSVLLNVQQHVILCEIDSEKLFSNIRDIQDLHVKFYKECLHDVLAKARSSKGLLSASDIATAFETFPERFNPYNKFCREEEKCIQYHREKQKENEAFKLFIDWCEQHAKSERRSLAELLVSPMQRLTKYPLLLGAVGKKDEDQDVQDIVKQRENEVGSFIKCVNHEVRKDHELERLEKVALRIESYDVVDSCNTEELTQLLAPKVLDLKSAMPNAMPNQVRWLILEGPMKLKDQEGKKMDATGLLFTDMLLVTKKLLKKGSNDKMRVIKQPMRVDRLQTMILKDQSGFAVVCEDEYGCAVSAFVVQSGQQTKLWLDSIQKAKEMYKDVCTKDADEIYESVTNVPTVIPDSSDPKTPDQFLESDPLPTVVITQNANFDDSSSLGPNDSFSSQSSPLATHGGSGNIFPISYEEDDYSDTSEPESFIPNRTVVPPTSLQAKADFKTCRNKSEGDREIFDKRNKLPLTASLDSANVKPESNDNAFNNPSLQQRWDVLATNRGVVSEPSSSMPSVTEETTGSVIEEGDLINGKFTAVYVPVSGSEDEADTTEDSPADVTAPSQPVKNGQVSNGTVEEEQKEEKRNRASMTRADAVEYNDVFSPEKSNESLNSSKEKVTTPTTPETKSKKGRKLSKTLSGKKNVFSVFRKNKDDSSDKGKGLAMKDGLAMNL